MRKRKKTICLKEGDVLIGFGHNTAIKYTIAGLHPKGGYTVKTVDEKPVVTFQYKSNIFTNGTTLYKNGLRCFISNNAKERQWKAIKARLGVVNKLKQLSAIVDWSKRASDARIVDIDKLLLNFFEEYKNLKTKKNGAKDRK